MVLYIFVKTNDLYFLNLAYFVICYHSSLKFNCLYALNIDCTINLLKYF